MDARSNLGAALAGTGRYAEAIPEYREALKRRPHDPHIRLNLALGAIQTGPDFGSSGVAGRAAREQPDDRQIMLLLADCWLRQGEDRKVIELLTPVEKREPDRPGDRISSGDGTVAR